MLWTGIIIGILIMSVFSFIAIRLLDDGKETWGIVFSGVITWIVVGFCYCIRAIKRAIKHKKYKALIVCPDNEIRYIDSDKADSFIEDNSGYELAYWKDNADNEHWNMLDWDKEHRPFGEIGNIRYAPKKVWNKYEKLKKGEYNARKQ